MNKLIFATNNLHKVAEIKSVIGDYFQVISLQEANIEVDIPEPYDTLEENAQQKSQFIYELTGNNCFSDDSGLEVEALYGLPGVKSARYAGEEKAAEANIKKLLHELKNHENRNAHFRTVISLVINGKEKSFQGVCEGSITKEPKGENGFGYDPIFIPSGSDKTFGEMEMDEKNQYSHRKKAITLFLTYLSQEGKNWCQ